MIASNSGNFNWFLELYIVPRSPIYVYWMTKSITQNQPVLRNKPPRPLGCGMCTYKQNESCHLKIMKYNLFQVFNSNPFHLTPFFSFDWHYVCLFPLLSFKWDVNIFSSLIFHLAIPRSVCSKFIFASQKVQFKLKTEIKCLLKDSWSDLLTP